MQIACRQRHESVKAAALDDKRPFCVGLTNRQRRGDDDAPEPGPRGHSDGDRGRLSIEMGLAETQHAPIRQAYV
jgi:hypothetical protein